MVAGRNYNVQTRSVSVGSSLLTAKTIGTAVPAGMTRYVTFIAVSPRSGSAVGGRKVYFCSTSNPAKISSTTTASTAAKWREMQISAVGKESNAHYPSRINTEAPLFTIAASKYLTVWQNEATKGSSPTSVFVQYYEQG